jgi:signal transduction histidine kinase
MIIWDLGLILQLLFAKRWNVSPIYFDYITYFGIVFLPIALLMTTRNFINPKLKFEKKHVALFIIPTLSLFTLYTNNFHHLFYIRYSTVLSEIIYGPFLYLHLAYTYGLIVLSLLLLLRHSVKVHGTFSVQSILFLLAICIPVIVNVVGMLNIFNMDIYITPISFTISVLLIAIAIFKFDFLNINSFALDLIVNTISDSYVVIDNENIITGYNNSFLRTFGFSENILNTSIFSLKFKTKNFQKDDIRVAVDLVKVKNSKITIDKHFEELDKYFSIDFSPIIKNKSYVGTLIYLNDVTEKEKDKLQIQSNQNLIIEQERLASLGQMIGGIAHNLKTPIFSISGGLEGLDDLVKEFDESIEDDTVTDEDMHAIAKDMKTWIYKLKNHISYMNEIITTVKSQAVTMSEEQNVLFPISELFQHVNILMQHEVKKHLAILNFSNSTPEDIRIKGNINSLVQVINNLISNAIEAYDAVPTKEKKVDVLAEYDDYDKSVIISVKDFGPGLPSEIQDKLFKEMITTKGKNGTGLGLFISASNIKAHFKGSLTFKTASNLGTTFIIKIPVIY